MRSTDVGSTWQSISCPVTSNLRWVSFADQNTGMAVGSSGKIIRTMDGGSTWVVQQSGTLNILYQVQMLNATTAVAVGSSGTILRTSDVGSTWTSIASNTTDLLTSVSFSDATHGVIVGDVGTVLYTSNGGITWTQGNSSTSELLYRAVLINAQNGWAVGYNGMILRTDDGGMTWTQSQSGVSDYLFGVAAVDTDLVFASGQYGLILKRDTRQGGAVPNAPTDLNAYAMGSNRIDLTWTDNSDDEQSFKVERRLSGTSTFTQIASLVVNSTSYSDGDGLMPNTTYNYRVRAYNSNGYSYYTNEASATTLGSGGSVPTITSFTPTSGPIGTTVTITGTNFNTTAANNYVFFGAVKAGVSTASSTSLSVTVPYGTTYKPITVTSSGLTAYSAKPFIVTFAGGGAITSSTFETKVDFAENSPASIAIGDLDRDGKPDLAVTNFSGNSVSVFRNTSISGSITNSSFAAKVDFATGNYACDVMIGDLDGDGQPDLAITNGNSNTVSVFRNTGTSGSITSSSFATKVDFATGNAPNRIVIGDLDGDGKPDLALTNDVSNTISVFRNTSTSGSITGSAFATKVDFATGSTPYGIAIADLDGNGKPDLAAVSNGSNIVSVFRNTSVSGSITSTSFASKMDFATGSAPAGIAVGDLDGDSKPDLVVTNTGSNTVSVFQNTSTSGSITFAARVDFTTDNHPDGIAISDLDGDGKVDLAVTNQNSNTISVFRNMSVSGTITSSSFATKMGFAIGNQSWTIAIGDLDGDGKPDLSASNWNSNTVSILRNTLGGGGTTPAAPVAQSATNITSSSFTAQWNSSTNATDYKLDVSTTNSFSSLLSGYADLSVGNVTSYNVTGLSALSTYYYRVRAIGAGGTSANSSVITVTTLEAGPAITHTTFTGEVVVQSGAVPTAITLRASATDPNGVTLMIMQYRQTGYATLYTVYFGAPYENNPAVQIPGNAFVDMGKAIGVDYRITATNSKNITSSTSWYSIKVRNGAGIIVQPGFTMPTASSYPSTELVKAYRIFSVPYKLDNGKMNFVQRGLGDHAKDGVSYRNWRLQRIVNGTKEDFDVFKDQAACYPGAGFFLIIREPGTTIQLDPVQDPYMTASASDLFNTGIQLTGGINGWYLVGTPLNTTIEWDSLECVGATKLDHAKYTGNGPASGWDRSINQLTPWEGLAVKTSGPCTVKFKTGISLSKEGTMLKIVEDEVKVISPSPNDWQVNVNAYRSDINMRCEGGGFGMRNGADIDHDQFDIYEPPTVGDKTVTFGFSGPNGPRLRDIRPIDVNGGVWEMRLTTIDAGARVKLNFEGAFSLPNPSFEIYLFDLGQKIAYNLKTKSTLEVGSGDGTKDFRIVVGKKEYLEENSEGISLTPKEAILFSNYPNPFNPETVIRYTIPDAASTYIVTLKIFNVLGQELATLVNGQQSSGYYEVKWDARTQSSGVYFYQMTVTDGNQTFRDMKRMLLIK